MSRRWLAVLALLGTAGSWGATFTLIKHVLSNIAPEPFIFWRFTVAGLILVAFAAYRRRLTAAMLVPGVTLGLLVFSGYWLQTRALLEISPSRSAFLTGLYVVMVPFADGVVYRTRVTLRAWMASVLAVVGTAVLIGGFEERPSIGDWLTILCAVTFALHVVFTARYTTQHAPIGLAAVQVLFVGIAAAGPAMLAPRPTFAPDVVIAIVFTAVVTTALAFAALMWGQAHVSATEAAVILSFEPVAASLTSILWDREPITVAFSIGALLILAAMIVSQLPDRPSATMRDDGADPGHQ